MKTGILFDLDGTLLNTLDDLTDAVNYTLRFYGLPERTMEEVRAFVGNGARQLVRLSLPGGGDDPSVDEALATYLAYYADHAQDKTCPYDGVLAALEEICREYPVAVVSNKPDQDTKPLCATYFGREIYALGQRDDCPKKPAPDVLIRAMEAIGVERCVYVGDSDVDVITAKNTGVPCLSVLWGFRDRDCLQASGATHFCEKPEDLPRCLKEMV